MERLMRKSLILALICASLGAQISFAKVLTVDEIRKAKKIGLMPGTFDPVTDGHLGAALAAVTQGGDDMVIMTPQENPHKDPIARADRLKMISLAIGDRDGIYYVPDNGPDDAPGDANDLYAVFAKKSVFLIAQKIRSINPDAEINLVAGTDFANNPVTSFLFQMTVRPDEWQIVSRVGSPAELTHFIESRPHQILNGPETNTSSSGVKKYLYDHVGQTGEVPGLEPEVTDYIRSQHLYEQPPKPGMLRCIVTQLLDVVWKK
jgi:nicotinic acid mononucleotide adenylyltransferase